ncbi:MFS transporter [Neobacillus sp. WH10]|uniref:MFS transporter n=1 Tax=Neobacillus sp. WH10 TaxID=3047873 RepID=UPI0024C11C46|nr:MFS transporter [Neobacillus sp. WH10]WHY78574.1 MFS transporter [Neobacillus sp. WH10]
MVISNSNQSRLYEYRVVALVFFAWGFIFLDRSALSYIVPTLVNDVPLTNGQIGQINMWQTIGYAIAGPLIGVISDKTERRKPLLIAAIFATTIFSALSGLANSYTSLLILRFLVGASEGPIFPLAMTMVAAASSYGRFGRNAGIVNAGVGVIAMTLGPILVTQLVSLTNWHWAFVMVSIPSLLLGILIWLFTSEVKPSSVEKQDIMEKREETKSSFLEIFKYRNVVVSILISICCMAGLWILYAFAPLYLTSVGQVSIQKMGVIMSSMGIVGIFTAIVIPIFSDYFGRKKGLIFFSFLAVLAPLGLYLFPMGWVGIGGLVLFGGMLGSITPIYMIIIPKESLPVHLTATSSALIIGIGEVIGSFILGGAGTLADSSGLSFVMIVSAVASLLMAILGFGLIETNSYKAKTISNKVIEKGLVETE